MQRKSRQFVQKSLPHFLCLLAQVLLESFLHKVLSLQIPEQQSRRLNKSNSSHLLWEDQQSSRLRRQISKENGLSNRSDLFFVSYVDYAVFISSTMWIVGPPVVDKPFSLTERTLSLPNYNANKDVMWLYHPGKIGWLKRLSWIWAWLSRNRWRLESADSVQEQISDAMGVLFVLFCLRNKKRSASARFALVPSMQVQVAIKS